MSAQKSNSNTVGLNFLAYINLRRRTFLIKLLLLNLKMDIDVDYEIKKLLYL
jgi:hypothetical protein